MMDQHLIKEGGEGSISTNASETGERFQGRTGQRQVPDPGGSTNFGIRDYYTTNEAEG